MDFQIRLKKYLINNLIREGEPEAWEHLKAMDLTVEELITLLINSPFGEDAWEMLLAKNPSVEQMLSVLKQSNKKEEAKAYLLARSPLDNDTLEDIVRETEDDQAAEMLLNQSPSHNQLGYVMQYSNLKDQAARMLLDDHPENDELIDILDYANLKQEAWEKLLLQSPTNDELSRIVMYTDWVEPAWEQLLKQNPTNEELMDFVHDYGDSGRKRREAAEILLQRELEKKDLVEMIRSDQLADEAWERLKAMDPDSEDLFYLYWRETVKTEEAIAWCLTKNPNENELWNMLDCEETADEVAIRLIQFPLELHKLADIAMHSTVEPVLNHVAEKVQFDRSQVDEGALIKALAEKLLQNPSLLNVNHWHDGETHCLGGWAIALVPEAQAIEKEYGSEIAAALLLPNYTHLFFADRETVMAGLGEVMAGK